MSAERPLWPGFAAIARRLADREALLVGPHRVSFADLLDAAVAQARALSARGVGRGDRIVIPMRPGPDAVSLPPALWRIGAVPVPVDARLARAALADLAGRVGGRWVEWGDDGPVLHGGPVTRPVPAGLASIVFTSGSSGQPKGVMQTHATLSAASAGVCRGLGIGPGDRLACAVSPGHDYGWVQLLSVYTRGVTLVLDETGAPDSMARTLALHRPTVLGGVPSIYGLWLRSFVDLDDAMRRGVRTVMSTGAPMPEPMVDALAALFPAAHVAVGYGLTETFRTAMRRPGEPAVPGTVGRAVDGVRISIRDPQGRSLPAGEIGEIHHHGLGACAGYWDAAAAARSPSPCAPDTVPTGDLGRLDAAGHLTVLDRVDRVIKSAGLKVSPAAVEAAMAAHPQLVAVAAVAVDHPILGRALCLFAEAGPGATVTPADLAQHARGVLPPEARPVSIRLVPRLPRTAGGKPDLGALGREAQGRASS